MHSKREKEIIAPPTICFVCEMKLNGKIISRDYLGDIYSFCSELCADKFVANPEEFIGEDDENSE